MKRIWFTQQKPFDYIPLKMGLGYITDFKKKGAQNYVHYARYCPKTYTTRTNPLSREYVVVEGSRFEAKPVEPRIEFQVRDCIKFFLDEEIQKIESWGAMPENLTFPELDLGIRGATFEMLRDELMRLNRKATLDTPFYINKLEAI